ncbi:MAG: AAA family ATPase [Pseudomonadota bacterium]
MRAVKITNRRILISGCSAGGKSSLLKAPAAAGHLTVAEAGRRIVKSEMVTGGRALPWVDMALFAQRALDTANADIMNIRAYNGFVFFDRGTVDAAVALSDTTGRPLAEILGAERDYDDLVFIAPPWAKLFRNDTERRHGFDDAVLEFERLTLAFDELGYQQIVLPQTPVDQRVAFVLDQISSVGNRSI